MLYDSIYMTSWKSECRIQNKYVDAGVWNGRGVNYKGLAWGKVWSDGTVLYVIVTIET